MVSTIKRHKPKPPSEASEALTDRISSLPDSVLFHILSFLPSKDAFRTTILSNRWRCLSASTPTIDLKFEQRFSPYGYGCDTSQRNFIDVVYKLLLFRNASIDKFYLSSYTPCDASTVKTWISAALFHCVKDLQLHIAPGQCWQTHAYGLPSDLVKRSEKLVVLKLSLKLEVRKVRMEARFPNLKILQLRYIVFPNDESSSKLFSACPVLQELHVCDCEFGNNTKSSVSVCTLKKLWVEHSIFYRENCQYEVCIECASLKELRLQDSRIRACALKNLHSLVSAHIAIRREHVLTCLSEEISSALENSVPCAYPNLTRLEVGLHFSDARTLINMLETSPKLKSLVISEGNRMDRDYDFPEHLPGCFSSCLLEVTFTAFGGSKNELSLAKYILGGATVLQRMTFTYKVPPADQLSITKKLASFPRGSRECVMIIT